MSQLVKKEMIDALQQLYLTMIIYTQQAAIVWPAELVVLWPTVKIVVQDESGQISIPRPKFEFSNANDYRALREEVEEIVKMQIPIKWVGLEFDLGVPQVDYPVRIMAKLYNA